MRTEIMNDDARQKGFAKLWLVLGVVVLLLAAAAAVYFFMPEKIKYTDQDAAQQEAPAVQPQPQPTIEKQEQSEIQEEKGTRSASEAESMAEDGAGVEAMGEEVSDAGVPALAVNRADHGLALIMDDTGYGLKPVEQALALSVPITFSILPGAPDASAAAEQAHQAGHIVMLHMPMEPKDPDIADKMMGKIGLSAGMSEAQLHRMMERALQKVPYASGVSNHMGSMLTEQADSMRWLMQDLKKRQMFFLDSLTTASSIARVQASKQGVAWASRRFFLDNDNNEVAMQRMWKKIIRRAKKAGGCIVIFHASPSSLAFLRSHLAETEGLVVPLSSLLHPAK